MTESLSEDFETIFNIKKTKRKNEIAICSKEGLNFALFNFERGIYVKLIDECYF